MAKLILSLIVCTSSLIIATFADGWGGHSNIFRKQHSSKGKSDYVFGYDIHDPWGAANFRKEKGHFTKKDGWVEGMYGLKDKDGRARIVKYVADSMGFRASIKTNEPGTSDADAADATYNGADKGKGKWMYDAKIKHDVPKKKDKGGWKDDKGGWKDDKGGWKAASHVKESKIMPAKLISSTNRENNHHPHPHPYNSDYGGHSDADIMREIQLHLKPQYDYYYALPTQQAN